MLGLSSDTWGAVGVLFGIGSAAVTAVYGRVSATDKKNHELEMAAIKTEHQNEIGRLEGRIDGICEDQEKLSENLKAAWVKIDDLRDNAVRKTELREYRAEVKQDMKDLGDRLERAIKDGLASLRKNP